MQGDCALTEASYKLATAARTLEHVLKKVEADIANAHSVDELLLRRQSVLRAERGRNEREAEKLERQKRTLANAARETEKSRRGLEREREALQKERTRSRAGLEHEAAREREAVEQEMAREREAVEQEMAREREAIKQELARLREDILREERGVPPLLIFLAKRLEANLPSGRFISVGEGDTRAALERIIGELKERALREVPDATRIL
jgi:chromosome segregation ATPase